MKELFAGVFVTVTIGILILLCIQVNSHNETIDNQETINAEQQAINEENAEVRAIQFEITKDQIEINDIFLEWMMLHEGGL